MKSSTKMLVVAALCVAIICVLAPIAIPIGPVPITLASFAVVFTGFLLGAKWGTIATVVYLIIGCIGVPVFSGYSGGFAKLIGPTGGYLIGYIVLALLCGLFYDKLGRNKKGFQRYLWMIVGVVLGTLVLYALGTAWFCIQSGTGVAAALGMCVIPFLPGDAIKCALAIIIVPLLERALIRAHVNLREPA